MSQEKKRSQLGSSPQIALKKKNLRKKVILLWWQLPPLSPRITWKNSLEIIKTASSDRKTLHGCKDLSHVSTIDFSSSNSSKPKSSSCKKNMKLKEHITLAINASFSNLKVIWNIGKADKMNKSMENLVQMKLHLNLKRLYKKLRLLKNHLKKLARLSCLEGVHYETKLKSMNQVASICSLVRLEVGK